MKKFISLLLVLVLVLSLVACSKPEEKKEEPQKEEKQEEKKEDAKKEDAKKEDSKEEKKEESKGSAVKVGMTVQSISNPIWAGICTETQKAIQEAGGELTYVACDSNVNTQIQQIENFVSNKVAEFRQTYS